MTLLVFFPCYPPNYIHGSITVFIAIVSFSVRHHKCTLGFTCNVCYFCSMLTNMEFGRHILVEIHNTTFQR